MFTIRLVSASGVSTRGPDSNPVHDSRSRRSPSATVAGFPLSSGSRQSCTL
jgi:hypothetical protein